MDKEFTKETIDGVDFYKMNLIINSLGISVHQTLYSSIINKFSFNIIIGYNDDLQKEELLKSINSIKFSN